MEALILSHQTSLHANSPSFRRRRSLLEGQDFDFSSRTTLNRTTSSVSSFGTRAAEVAGGTTAGCAAICCCCPIGLVNIFLLAVYKLPAGLYKKALKKKRRQKLIKNGMALSPSGQIFPSGESEVFFPSSSAPLPMILVDDHRKDKDVLALEEEMWGTFLSTGFWRSNSQKNDGGMQLAVERSQISC